MSEETLFHEALARPAAERATFLDAACAGNPELRAAVEALLAAHVASGDFLDRPPLDPGEAGPTSTAALTPPGATAEHHPQVEPGRVLAGRYTLVEKIGEGGMGEVWVAKQTEPVKRKVALKLIKTGMDSKAVLARFEAERQALALMDHPNIARVLDGGLTPTGQPFFVMELVNGVTLTKFCDEARLTPQLRLELFVPICAAVQHAHQKGIVHRDLKPSNILVTLIDGKPVPKIIDFGVAKATAGKLTDESLSTQFGAILGTFEYMAPEQAGYAGTDVDTRADVYSLGVILYELLTGLRPLDARRLRQAALTEMVRILREEEPARPSTRLSTAEGLASLAALRQTEPRKLMALLRGELDWVVMKCLEKQRDRRYETANALARDLQRYLADEPVEARPPSTRYRVQKFVQRHRGPVLAASLVLFALVAGIAGTTFGLIGAEHARAAEAEQRERAEAKEREANGEKVKALAAVRAKQEALIEAAAKQRAAEKAAAAERLAKQEAETNLAYARKGIDILGSVFVGLDPDREYATLADLRNALKENLMGAVRDMDDAAIRDPLTLAGLQHVLGLSLLKLGEAKPALVLFEKALAKRQALLGADHPHTLASRNNLASAYLKDGQVKKAVPFLEALLEKCQATLPANHPTILTCMNNLATAYCGDGQVKKAIPLLEAALEKHQATHGANHPDTLRSMNNLAGAYLTNGQVKKAIPLLEAALEKSQATHGADHPDTLLSMNNLAAAYGKSGHERKAIPLLEAALEKSQVSLGAGHPLTLACMTNLATGYQKDGQVRKATPLLEAALDKSQVSLGASHPDTLMITIYLGEAYREDRQVKQSIPLLEAALKKCKATLGAGHPTTLHCIAVLALAYQADGQAKKAIPLLEAALEKSQTTRGVSHPDTLACMNNLGEAYREDGRVKKAIPLLEAALEKSQTTRGVSHPDTLTCMNNLALAYQADGQVKKAIPLLEAALEKSQATHGADHPDTLACMNNLAMAYQADDQLKKAIPLLEAVLEKCPGTFGADHPNTLSCMGNLGMAYVKDGQVKKAIPLLEAALEKRQTKLPAGHPDILVSMRNLALAYGETGQGAKAAALLRGFITGQRKRFAKDDPRFANGLAAVSRNLLTWRQWEAAEEMLRECLAIRTKAEPNAWLTFNTRSALGGALLGQKKYAEAEPLLLAGYEGMKQREQTIPAAAKGRIREALERLVQLYEATGKPDEAAKWRKELKARQEKDSKK